MLSSHLRVCNLTCHRARRRHLRCLITLAGVRGQSRPSQSYASSSYCWATTGYWNDCSVEWSPVDLGSKTLLILPRKSMAMDWRPQGFICYLYHSSKRMKNSNQRQVSIRNALFVWVNSKKGNWLNNYRIAIIRFIVLASTPGSVIIRVVHSADCKSRVSLSISLLLILLWECWRRLEEKTFYEKEYRIIKHFVLKICSTRNWEEMHRFKDQINETDRTNQSTEDETELTTIFLSSL